MKKTFLLSTFFISTLFGAEERKESEDMRGKTELIFLTNQALKLTVNFESIYNTTGEPKSQSTTIVTNPETASHFSFRTNHVTTFLKSIMCRPVEKPYSEKLEEEIVLEAPLKLKEKTKAAITINAALLIDKTEWLLQQNGSITFGAKEAFLSITADVEEITFK